MWAKMIEYFISYCYNIKNLNCTSFLYWGMLQLSTQLKQSFFHIEGDSGGICTTLGNDSMSDSKQKSSYEHGSDFERLRSYDRLKLGIEGNDY